MAEDAASTRSTQVAIVTGAGSGIGRAIAVKLGASGFRLVLAGRHEQSLCETGAMISTPWLARVTDMADYEAVAQLIEEATTWGGRLDVLVNCAGAAPMVPIDRTTPDLLEETYRVNALGPAHAISRAWPIMAKQRSGCIVNISSMATADPFDGFFMYAGAKAACNLMAKSCASEGKELGIRAFAVAPGAVETPMLRRNFDESQIPASRCLSPEEVADVVAACITGERDAENGQTIFLKSP